MNKYALKSLLPSKLFLTLGAFLLLTCPAQALAADALPVVESAESRSLAFMYYNSGGYSGNCSGYYVKSGSEVRLATARHCLGFSKSWSIYPYGPLVKSSDNMQPRADKYKRSFSSSNTIIDGIDHLLDGKAVGVSSYFELSSQDPPTGSALKIYGYPMGVGPKEFSCVLKGYIMRPKQIAGQVENGVLGFIACLGANIQPGISGGPVLNARGEVIGTISAKASAVIALFSPNYLAGLETLKMYKIVDNKFVEDTEQTMCFSRDHRLLPLSKCQ